MAVKARHQRGEEYGSSGVGGGYGSVAIQWRNGVTEAKMKYHDSYMAVSIVIMTINLNAANMANGVTVNNAGSYSMCSIQ